MYNPKNAFAEAASTIRRCVKEKLVTLETEDNSGTTMRESAEAPHVVLDEFFEATANGSVRTAPDKRKAPAIASAAWPKNGALTTRPGVLRASGPR